MSSLLEIIVIFQVFLVLSLNALPQVKVENSIVKENGTTRQITKYSIKSINSNVTQDEDIAKLLSGLKIDDLLEQDQNKINVGGKKYRVYIKRKVRTSRRPSKISNVRTENSVRINSYQTVDNPTIDGTEIKNKINWITVPKIVNSTENTVSSDPLEILSGQSTEMIESVFQNANTNNMLSELEQKGQEEITPGSNEVEALTKDVANYDDSTLNLEETVIVKEAEKTNETTNIDLNHLQSSNVARHVQELDNVQKKWHIETEQEQNQEVLLPLEKITENNVASYSDSSLSDSLTLTSQDSYNQNDRISDDLNSHNSYQVDSNNVHSFDVIKIKSIAHLCPECFGRIYAEMLQREKMGLIQAHELSTLELFKEIASTTLMPSLATMKHTKNLDCKMLIPEEQVSSANIQQEQPQSVTDNINYEVVDEKDHHDSAHASEGHIIEEDNAKNSGQNVEQNSYIAHEYVNQEQIPSDYVLPEEVDVSAVNINQQPNSFLDTVEPNQEDIRLLTLSAPTDLSLSHILQENKDNVTGQSHSSGMYQEKIYVVPSIIKKQVPLPEIAPNFSMGDPVDWMASPSSLTTQENIHKPIGQIQPEVPSIYEQEVQQPEIDQSHVVGEYQDTLQSSLSSQENIQLDQINIPIGNQEQTFAMPDSTSIDIEASGANQKFENVQSFVDSHSINGGRLEWTSLPASQISQENTHNLKVQSPSSDVYQDQTFVVPTISEKEVQPIVIDQGFIGEGDQVDWMALPQSQISQETIYKPTGQVENDQTSIPSSNSYLDHTYVQPGVTNKEIQTSGTGQNFPNMLDFTPSDTINAGQLDLANLPSSQLVTYDLDDGQKPIPSTYSYEKHPYIVHGIPNQETHVSETGQNFANTQNIGNLYYGMNSLGSNNRLIPYLFSIKNLRRMIWLLKRRLIIDPNVQVSNFLKMIKLIMIILRSQMIGDNSVNLLWFRQLKPDIQNRLIYYVSNLVQQNWLQTLMIRLHESKYNFNILKNRQWTPYLLTWDNGLDHYINNFLERDELVAHSQRSPGILSIAKHYIHPPRVYHIISTDKSPRNLHSLLRNVLKRSKRN